MAKGDQAKQNIIEKLAECFGENYQGVYDKKVYVKANENGEMIQIAISLTCPKTPVQFENTVDSSGDWDFTKSKPNIAESAVKQAPPAEITEEEEENLRELMKRLGL